MDMYGLDFQVIQCRCISRVFDIDLECLISMCPKKLLIDMVLTCFYLILL